MADLSLRRVVTQVRADGSAEFASDGPPARTISAPDGFGLSELLWFDSVPADRDAGRSRGREEVGSPLEPPAGGMSSCIIRLPGGDGWRRLSDGTADLGAQPADTFDLVVVLEGGIVLGLEDDEIAVEAGDVVIQRGTNHRWRAQVGCTYWVTKLRPDPSKPLLSLSWAADAESPVRRIITDGDTAHDGHAPVALEAPGTTVVDVWQTGGPLATAMQGGDVGGAWDIEPAGGGVAMRWFEMPPARDFGPEVGWHTTATIDIDVVLSGRVALELPGGSRAELGAGDVVIQRGTDHRWLTLGDEPVRMVALMFAVPS